jgi:sarcosine oxidase / L-pipecolate oxidase
MPQGLPFDGRLDPELAPHAKSVMQRFLADTIPSLQHATIDSTRMCLYCDTWDSNFYITYVPFADNLFIAAGGSGHGFKFAPLLGDIIADAIEHRPNATQHVFAWREPDQAAERRDSCRPAVETSQWLQASL